MGLCDTDATMSCKQEVDVHYNAEAASTNVKSFLLVGTEF